jgi:regulator of replication initiation timing
MKLGFRKEALLQGLIYYNNGKPCKYGHYSDRRVKDGVCLQCDRERYSNTLYKTSEIAFPRKHAIEAGVDFYTTGLPCLNGHIGSRRTKDSSCIECEKQRRKSDYFEKYKTDDAAFKKQFYDLRGRAKAKGVPFSIELDDIDRPEFCPVLGTKLRYGINHNTEEAKWKKHPDRASFDKVIPSLGYVPGNVFIISLEANRLKSNASLEQLEALVNYIKRNKKNGETI